MKSLVRGIISIGCSLVSIVPVLAGNFGFGINESGGEDDTIVATHEISVGGIKNNQEEGLVDNVVKSFVNWFLGILGLIALLVMLYGGFLMLTAADNKETYTKGWKVLKNGAVGLVLIGVAWFVISIIFWLIVQAGDGVSGANTDS